MSYGTTICPVLCCASSSRENEATRCSIGLPAARVASQSACMEFGLLRRRGARRKSCSARSRGGGNPAEERKLDREAITVKELCTRYLEGLRNGLILGKRGRPKKPTTIATDLGRIERHIVPLLGNRRVRDLAKSDITQAMKDIMAGNTRANVKTDKLRGLVARPCRYGSKRAFA